MINRHIDSLILKDRQRTTIVKTDLQDLKDSISKHGLLHPIVVHEGHVLAGGRRFLAIRELSSEGVEITHAGKRVPLGHVPCTELSGELSDLGKREIEYDENKIRSPLSWEDEAKALASLHELRDLQKKEKGESPQTFTDTASEAIGRLAEGGAITKVREAVDIVRYLDHPSVKNAGSIKKAARAVKALRRAEAAKESRVEINPILIGDSFELMPKLPSESFDCILTDPPYGINADTLQQGIHSHQYNDSLEYALSCYTLLAKEGFRVCRPQAHLFAFCTIKYFPKLASIFTLEGWRVWEYPLIWTKRLGAMIDAQRGPRHTYEAILFASKGDKPIIKMIDDTFACDLQETKIHAAQKPIELYMRLLSMTSVEGERVLDPFAGSGTIFPAAQALHMEAVGIELEKSFSANASEQKANSLENLLS